MTKNILLQNTAKGHILRSLILVAIVGAYAQKVQQGHAVAEQADLRDAVRSVRPIKRQPVMVMPTNKPLPTTYNPSQDGLMMLSQAQIGAHQRRVARVNTRIAKVKKAAQRKKAAKRKVRQQRKAAQKIKKAAPRNARAIELYKRTRGQLRKSRSGGIAGFN
jgi:hypothetical protein